MTSFEEEETPGIAAMPGVFLWNGSAFLETHANWANQRATMPVGSSADECYFPSYRTHDPIVSMQRFTTLIVEQACEGIMKLLRWISTLNNPP